MGDASDDGGRRPQTPPLLDATIEQLHEGLVNGLFTSVDLVNAYIARINEVNAQLHAVTEINPEALKIAAEKDYERRGKSRSGIGLLHGIPVLLKNTIATYDQMNNTAGSYALVGAKVARDATVVQKLREAGAIILGKANLSQWSNARSSNSSNGWSAHGGQVYGAYVEQQDACGSSSGSAVASAIALAAASLGVETDGSITCPVGRSNVVGIKPTVGLTSRYLVIPVSEHQDTVGPIARTVRDAAIVLQAIAGVDPVGKYTYEIPKQDTISNYLSACALNALKGARLGVPDNAIALYQDKTTQFQVDAFNTAVEKMQSAGATIIRNTDFPAAAEYLESLGPTKLGGSSAARADFIVNIASYFKELSHNPNSIKSLEDLQSFTRSDPREQYPDRDTAEWDRILAQGWDNTSPKFQEEYNRVLRYGEEGGLLGTLKKYDLDAVVLPTAFAPRWAAMVGTPIVTVPLGAYPKDTVVEKNPRGDLIKMGPNFPFGISFLGAKWSEEKLIGYAYAFEQMTKTREKIKPLVQPKTEIRDVLANTVKGEASQPPEMPLQWIQNTELIEVPAGAQRLLEDYSRIPPSEIMSHINQVRARALDTFPYPCLGHYRFLDIQIVKSRAYQEIRDRLARGQRLLEVGCCIGQELRQLAADGAPSEKLYGTDLYGEFFDIGYDLFRDKNAFRATFIAADLFAADSPISSLASEIDIIWNSNLLHLFSWDKQLTALQTMLKLLSKSPNPLIAGRFMGYSSPGEYTFAFKGEQQSTYRHNDVSFRRLFQMTCEGLGEWEVDVEAPEWKETLRLRTLDKPVRTWDIEVKFVGRRVGK